VLAAPLLVRLRRQAAALAGIIIGTVVILGGVLLHNSVVAGKPTGFSENSGLNFWMGHCDVHDVTTIDPRRNLFFEFANPVWFNWGEGAATTSRDASRGTSRSSTTWAYGASGGTDSVMFAFWPAASWT
jgi:hypothetical protein